MSESKEPKTTDHAAQSRDERVIYLLPQDTALEQDPRLQLSDLLDDFWRGRKVILAAMFLAGAIGISYAMLATSWYRAEVVLVPTQREFGEGLASQLAQLAPLAGLAGISLGSDNKAEPMAVLQSKSFSRSFIEDEGLLPVLFAEKWDPVGKKWKSSSRPAPDIRDAVEYFGKDIRRVFEDRKTGIVRLSIEWKDPQLASTWANLMAKRLNGQMRERALDDARRNVTFLQNELGATNVVSLQQSIGRLLETELQKLMLARGNEEFAFRVVDTAEVPKKRARPQRKIIFAGSLIAGALLGAALVMFRRRRRVEVAD